MYVYVYIHDICPHLYSYVYEEIERLVEEAARYVCLWRIHDYKY
jgi:hypothetical protein